MTPAEGRRPRGRISYDFAGTTHLVTGGSRGIGRAVVTALARAGGRVAFTYLKDERAAAAVVDEAGGKVVAVRFDARAGATAAALVDRVESEVGEIAGVVNNAGIRLDRAAFQLAADDWEAVLATNLSGSFFVAQAVMRRLIQRDGGKIVNVASVSGLRGIEGQANYAASKGGLIALTRCLAREVARFNVQVNAVAPGFVETDMVGALPDKVKAEHLKRVPARRFASPAEVAASILFLLSEASDYVVGETLVVDGGLSA